STPSRGRQATHSRSAAGVPRSPATKTSSMAALTVGNSSSTHRLRLRDGANAVATQLAGRRCEAVAHGSPIVASRLVAAGTHNDRLRWKEGVRCVDQPLGHATRRLRLEADAPRGKVQTNPSTWNFFMMTQKARKQ
ncbi:MAG TPA: hypothetical protein VFG00_02885, partial [Acidothermaceae bacterium]|nr:hypothetical protein [Acidothermaceae bacterium]